MEKDTMIKFRSTIKGKNIKGGDRLQLYLSLDDARELAATLESKLGEASDRGVKIDLHTTERETDGGRKFLASFAFVKTVEAQAEKPAPKQFAPKRVG
jgi:hypothetical protein